MEDALLKLLQDEHALSAEQYRQIEAECKQSGDSVDVVLDRSGILREADFLNLLSRKFRLPLVNWENVAPPQAETLQLVPEDVAKKYTVFPVAFERGKRSKITLAVAYPSNLAALDDIAFMTGCLLKTEIASARAIRSAIQTHYAGKMPLPGMPQKSKTRPAKGAAFESSVPALNALLAEVVGGAEFGETDGADALTMLDRDHPASKLLIDLLNAAVERGYAELHILPSPSQQRIRALRNGVMIDHADVPEQLGRGIAQRLRKISRPVEAALSPKKEPVAHEGVLSTRQIGGGLLNVAVSFFPTPFGESAVLKLCPQGAAKELEELGMDEAVAKGLARAVVRPFGMLLVAAPHGEGKTATLAAILRKYFPADASIVAAASPAEPLAPRVTQLSRHAQMSYRDWCSVIAYLAPNALAFDTIDEPLMAQVAWEFAASAPVVASVTAAGGADALSTVVMTAAAAAGLPVKEALPLFVDALNGVVAQHLVKTICPHCKQEAALSDEDKTLVETAFVGKGCAECLNTGYSGQIGLFDLVKIDKGFKHALLDSPSAFAMPLRRLCEEFGTSAMRPQGLQWVREGKTSLAEFRRIFGG